MCVHPSYLKSFALLNRAPVHPTECRLIASSAVSPVFPRYCGDIVPNSVARIFTEDHPCIERIEHLAFPAARLPALRSRYSPLPRFARRLAPRGRDTAMTRRAIEYVSFRFGWSFPRIIGPGCRCVRQFRSRGGTPRIPKHVNPAPRRPWTRETGRSVERAQFVPAWINTQRCRAGAARAILCNAFPSHPRARQGRLLKCSLPPSTER